MGVDDRRVMNCGDEDLSGVRLLRPCPQTWADLESTAEARVRHCGVCKQRVYRVANRLEARVRAEQGECIAVPPSVRERVVERAASRSLIVERGLLLGSESPGALFED